MRLQNTSLTPKSILWLGILSLCLFQGQVQSIYASDLLHILPSSAQDDSGIEVKPVSNQPLFLEAQQLSYDQKQGIYVAKGGVQVHYAGRRARGDYMEYDPLKKTLMAKGNVQVQETATGDTLFAESLMLDEGLTAGFAEGIALRLGKYVKVVGNSAKQVSPTVTEMNQVTYTPCKLCADGKSPPLWQMKADKITRNTEEKTIEYTNPVLEVEGIPVLEAPYFSHPDPTVKRKTGFLLPKFIAESENGYGVRLPFYWDIAPDQDLKLLPTIYANASPLIRGIYRHHTKSGLYTADLSGTFSDKGKGTGTDTIANTYTNNSFRGAILSNGRFFAGDADSWGFTLNKSTDDTFLRRYDIFNESYLTNKFYYEHPFEGDKGYVNGYMFAYQGLGTNTKSGTNPLILPFIEGKRQLDRKIANGTLTVNGNLLSIYRKEGLQTQRLSTSMNWDRKDFLSNGLQIKTFGELRSDGYHTTAGFDPTVTSQALEKGFKGRFVPMMGTEISLPFYGQHQDFQDIIEPIAQLIWSPYGGNPSAIPNEDSAALDFTDENLFSRNRFAGYDRIETGPRMNVGVRHHFDFNDGQKASYTFGQNFRLKEDKMFLEDSGLAGTRSDYVGRVSYSPHRNLELFHAFRYDEDNFKPKQAEIGANVNYGRLRFMADYVDHKGSVLGNVQDKRREFVTAAHLNITDGWIVYGGARRDLHNDRMIETQGGLGYAADCLILNAYVKRQFIQDRDIQPSTSVGLNVTLLPFGRTDKEEK